MRAKASLWIVAALALLAGCQGKMTPSDTITMLERAGAEGHLVITAGGSPLSAGMSQNFYLGSPQMSVSFDGSIDFGEAPPAPLDVGPGE